MITVKQDLEQRIDALPAAPPNEAYEAVMNVVTQVKESVLRDLRQQISLMPVEEKIDFLAQLLAKHEVDAAMQDIGFKRLLAQLSSG